MKNLIILLLIVLFISSLVFAKEKTVSKDITIPVVTTETPYYKITIKPTEISKAGDNLIRFKNASYIGYALTFGGAIVIYFGIRNTNEEGKPNDNMLIGGGLLSLVGQIILITASDKIEKAGKHLQEAIIYEKKWFTKAIIYRD